ncbi:FAD-dependent oxidoreductase [Commensalibacter sp. M0402]|uniref:NAD(P)/FAD-dependent oxidoreductase n=1 Tax=Commensalibacter TaxID=1079922 RepID=UPI0018DBC67E|nr:MULTISPECIES: FAD-dependent oxidoreductase [Commensalibacter]MBI0083537.1 FAD-dependent oxidoreductase [Commensalibacter sp. W6292M3]MBI0088867.1 FAD-dependent oxidoreductase [Commensalibacter melissae]
MIRVTEVKLPLDHDEADLKQALYNRLKQFPSEYQVIRRGYDARRRGDIQLVYTIDCSIDNEEEFLRNHSLDRNLSKTPEVRYQFVMSRQTGEKIANQASYVRPVVIGAGPCGVMAGLLLAQMGLRPLILERGKPVRERTVDTFAFWRQSKFNPDSNVQYGEGGAGTFSDGKLHTQISDPYHYGHKVLTEFVRAGAPEEILYVSKPHIGTFRLVSMVEKIRQEIESFGGQYRFNTYVQKILMNKNRQIVGVQLVDGQEIQTNHIILATGHSAREMMHALYEDGVEIQAKPFSVGVRIEHPQTLIDKARFGSQAGHQLLGAADYKLVHHDADKRGVYSFCMCPGGTVIAAASEEGGIVTNGMSQYSRAERNANAAIVVGVQPERDYAGHPLAGIAFQRDLERKAFQLGGANYKAPVQRVEDFLLGRATRTLGSVVPSYKPGVEPDDLAEILPSFVINGIREALPAFNRKLSGFNFADAVMTGVETRTSSPVRIPRMDDGQSVNTSGLYPAGEGAGYAGGIMSAAIDGIKIAEKVAQNIHDNHQ